MGKKSKSPSKRKSGAEPSSRKKIAPPEFAEEASDEVAKLVPLDAESQPRASASSSVRSSEPLREMRDRKRRSGPSGKIPRTDFAEEVEDDEVTGIVPSDDLESGGLPSIPSAESEDLLGKKKHKSRRKKSGSGRKKSGSRRKQSDLSNSTAGIISSTREEEGGVRPGAMAIRGTTGEIGDSDLESWSLSGPLGRDDQGISREDPFQPDTRITRVAASRYARRYPDDQPRLTSSEMLMPRIPQAYVVLEETDEQLDPNKNKPDGNFELEEQEIMNAVGTTKPENDAPCLSCQLNCSKKNVVIIGVIALAVIGAIIGIVLTMTGGGGNGGVKGSVGGPASMDQIDTNPTPMDTAPTTSTPTTASPTEPKTNEPTTAPTTPPTEMPTTAPSTSAPTPDPTETPTTSPPTDSPTTPPTLAPTHIPAYDDQAYTGADKWIRVGPTDILLGDANDLLGSHSIAISGDGTTVAVGSQFNSDSAPFAGTVAVHRIAKSEDNSGFLLEPLGLPLAGANTGDFFGAGLALSRDGSRLAAGSGWLSESSRGSVIVYEYDGFRWQTLGAMFGTISEEFFGWSITMSADGSIVAIGAPLNNVVGEHAGLVQVFQLQLDGNWTQMGQDLFGNSSHNRFGYDVALTDDGLTLAVGADQINIGSGQVRVFSWNGTTWEPVGQALSGSADADTFGVSVSLSMDGGVLAVGAPGYDFARFANIGHVQFFGLSNLTGLWEDVRPPILGENDDEWLGYSIDLSDDGRTCAVGIPWRVSSWNETAPDAGWTVVYEYDGNRWNQKGQWTEGSTADDRYGNDVAISGDGNVIVASAPYSNANGEESGEVRVYRQGGEQDSAPSVKWEIYGQPPNSSAPGDTFGFSLSLTSDGTQIAVGFPTSNQDDGGYAEVYRFSDDRWVLTGSRLMADDTFGYSVALSDDGSTLIVGVPDSEFGLGKVRHYEYGESNWTEITQLNGTDADERLGVSVGMSDDGLILAAAAWLNSEIIFQAGALDVYQRDNITSPWVPMGSPIYGRELGEVLGRSLSLSGDGKTVAAEALNDTSTVGYGRIRVFSYNDTDWHQVGQDLMGFEQDLNFWHLKLALNRDGTILAVGSFIFGETGAEEKPGTIHVYQLSSDRQKWNQIGDTLNGYTVDLSHDGRTLAVGAPYHDIPTRVGIDHGLLRVYGWFGSNWQQLGDDLLGENEGDGFGLSVALSGDGSTVVGGAPLAGALAGYVRIYRQTRT